MSRSALEVRYAIRRKSPYETESCALLVAGFVDRRPAVLVQDPREPARGWRHFVLLEWADDLIVTIRDFRYASYVIECAELQRLQVIGSS